MKPSLRPLPLLLALVLLPSVTFGQADSLVIATFNCEFLIRSKVHIKFGLPFEIDDASAAEQQQWSQPGFRDQRFAEAVQAVAHVLAPIQADVLALTEVGDAPDVTALRDSLHALGAIYPHVAVGRSRDTATGQHVAVLSKFPLSDLVEEIPGRESFLREPDDPETEDDTGVSKGMRVSVTTHARTFLLYVLHLASERGGYDQDQQRIAQASIVRRHYLPELTQGRLVIVAGDLNDHRGEPTLLRLRGFDDLYADLIQTGHARYFRETQLDTRWTYAFEGMLQQIDHILLAHTVRDETRSSGGIRARTVTHNNTLASDHRPLVVTLTLR